jgi:hypothetical protein
VGRLDAVWISATGAAAVVSDSISHCAPTVCIQLPMLLTSCAVHIARKSPDRNGPHGEGALAGCEGAGMG